MDRRRTIPTTGFRLTSSAGSRIACANATNAAGMPRLPLLGQAATDAALRDQLIAACNGNFTPGPGIQDISPIKGALELVPLDLVCRVIGWKVNKLCYRANATLVSWREPRLLKAIVAEFCESIIIPNLVDAWSKATGTAPGKAASASEPSPAVQVPPKPKSAPAASPPQPDRRC
jgi:hypothetical protein